ncbi:hypothetical protein RFI_27403 [Reticulomyxa filosa]|uniref:C2 domain-containing protein n=1 Tax=Reticulomyxa filosa TaxID=46433 RepID=X6M7L4_RETFI|nr:hypothetical protein RFI_27403 [Reticulomyxa filosa]|eukprot:ETO09973.1 hypothetical protein RFI_27403 [Reticulomyxa filosa]
MSFLPNQPTPAVVLSSQLELFFSCRNLPKLDVNSPSDPFVVISRKDEKKNDYVRLNHTEVAKDNQSPDFTKEILVDYLFEEVQIIRLDVWDSDNSNMYDMSKHDFIGWAEFVLGDLVTAKGQKLAMKLKNKQGKPLIVKEMPASITVRCEEVKSNNDELVLAVGAKDLPKAGW